MSTQWTKCKQCNGSGNVGSFFSKTPCTRCEGKGRLLNTQFERLIDELYARMPEDPKQRQLSNILQLKEFLDKFCVLNPSLLDDICVEHMTEYMSDETQPLFKLQPAAERRLDYFYRMIAAAYGDIGKFFTTGNKIESWRNNPENFQRYLTCATQAYETAIVIAEKAPSDGDGGTNHLKVVAYFGLGQLAMSQNGKKMNAEAKHYFRTCTALPLHTQHQKAYAGDLQVFARQVESMSL